MYKQNALSYIHFQLKKIEGLNRLVLYILFLKLKDYLTRVLISGYDEFISTSETSISININDYVGRKGN